MSEWCNDCAWPVECAAAGECHRRAAGGIRPAATGEEAAAIRLEFDASVSDVFSDTAELFRRAYLGRGA